MSNEDSLVLATGEKLDYYLLCILDLGCTLHVSKLEIV